MLTHILKCRYSTCRFRRLSESNYYISSQFLYSCLLHRFLLDFRKYCRRKYLFLRLKNDTITLNSKIYVDSVFHNHSIVFHRFLLSYYTMWSTHTSTMGILNYRYILMTWYPPYNWNSIWIDDFRHMLNNFNLRLSLSEKFIKNFSYLWYQLSRLDHEF